MAVFIIFRYKDLFFLAFHLGPFKSHRQRGTVFIDLLVRLVRRFLPVFLVDGGVQECRDQPRLAFFQTCLLRVPVSERKFRAQRCCQGHSLLDPSLGAGVPAL